jgi:hypothetical protein
MTFLVPFIVGTITGWFAHLWSCKRDAENRLKSAKIDFGIAVQKHIDAVPERNLLDFYNRTKPDIRLGVVTFKQHLCPADLVRIDALWSEFDKAVWKTINAAEPNIPASTSKLLHELAKTPYNPESNQDRLKAVLARFYDYSK